MARPKIPIKASQKRKHKVKSGRGGDGSALEKIIAAIGHLHAIGMENPSRQVVGVYAGVSAETSTMRAACAKMKKDDIADTSDPKTLKLTGKGLNHHALQNVNLPPFSNATYIECLKNMMEGGGKSRQVLDALAVGPPLSREDIGRLIQIDTTKSTFRAVLSPLNKMNLLEEVMHDGMKCLRLVDACFPLGRYHVSGAV